MNELTIALLASAVAVVLFGGRRAALFSLIAASIVLTKGQSIVLGGISLYPVRLLTLAGFLRVVIRGELAPIRWNRLDLVVLVAYLYCTAMFSFREITGDGTVGVAQVSLADRIGTFADVTSAYVSIRSLLRDSDDIVWLFKTLVLLLVPYVGLLAIERVTGLNPFAAVGGVEHIWRDDRIRCRGSFMHPSLLGSFGASLVPLYIGIILSGKRAVLAAIGLLCALTIVALSNSGGPITFAAVAVGGWALWPARKYMRRIRYCMLAMFVMLAIVMKAPIWYLPDKVSAFTGGDGWHRSYLMDQTIRHFSDWWLAGMPLNDAKTWFPYLAMGGLDITNLFVAFGLDSGILGMMLLVAVFVVAYSRLGHSLHRLSASLGDPSKLSMICWALGAALTGHLVNFFAITYFDQMYILWLLLLVSIATLSSTDVPIGGIELAQPFDRKKARSRPARPPIAKMQPRTNAELASSQRRLLKTSSPFADGKFCSPPTRWK